MAAFRSLISGVFFSFSASSRFCEASNCACRVESVAGFGQGSGWALGEDRGSKPREDGPSRSSRESHRGSSLLVMKDPGLAVEPQDLEFLPSLQTAKSPLELLGRVAQSKLSSTAERVEGLQAPFRLVHVCHKVVVQQIKKARLGRG